DVPDGAAVFPVAFDLVEGWHVAVLGEGPLGDLDRLVLADGADRQPARTGRAGVIVIVTVECPIAVDVDSDDVTGFDVDVNLVVIAEFDVPDGAAVFPVAFDLVEGWHVAVLGEGPLGDLDRLVLADGAVRRRILAGRAGVVVSLDSIVVRRCGLLGYRRFADRRRRGRLRRTSGHGDRADCGRGKGDTTDGGGDGGAATRLV